VIESTLYSVLSTAPRITAITSTRIHPLVIPEGSTLPAISYSIVGGAVKPTFSNNGTQRLRVELNCWGATYGDAITLRNAVVQSIDGYNEQGISIQYLMPQDFFDHELLQYRALVEFYLYASV
jgi:hypothetical protein